MEVFELDRYYKITAKTKLHDKLYTCKVIGLDDEFIRIMDAKENEVIIAKDDLITPVAVITQEEYEEQVSKERFKRQHFAR